jgi:hypothetical protein
MLRNMHLQIWKIIANQLIARKMRMCATDEPTVSHGVDAPLQNYKDDALDRVQFAERIFKLITGC